MAGLTPGLDLTSFRAMLVDPQGAFKVVEELNKFINYDLNLFFIFFFFPARALLMSKESGLELLSSSPSHPSHDLSS